MSLTAIVNTSGFKFRGIWSSSTSYGVNDVVVRNNSVWVSIATSNLNHDPYTDNGTHWTLFAGGFFYRSTWSSGTTYSLDDVVTYNSSTYVSLQNSNTNHQPDISPTFWSLMAAQGQVAPRQSYTFTMPSASITSVQITSNVVTLSVVNTFAAQGLVVPPITTGQLSTVYITGLTNATFLNGQVLTITSLSGTQIQANFTHANYGPTAETSTNNIWLSIPVNGIYWTTQATGSVIPLGKTFALSYVTCLQANRIELYSSQASRTADSSRPATTQPTAGTQHGVITDLNLDGVQASFTSWIMSPLAYGANIDTTGGTAVPPTGTNYDTVNIPAALTNISGAATTNTFAITFYFTYEEQ